MENRGNTMAKALPPVPVMVALQTMKVVFNANNSLEAHLALGLLRQVGIEGVINGEYLQGGMGELPVFGLVTVLVSEQDYREASEVIADWQQNILAWSGPPALSGT